MDITAPLLPNAHSTASNSQRLSGARRAFQQDSAADSIQVHKEWIQKGVTEDVTPVGAVHPEPQLREGPFIKPFVFGGLDGVGTSFALLAGSFGSDLRFLQMLAMCSATIFASAFSMGFGEYVSGKAERDIALREQARERWEVDVFPEGEVAEMIDLYKKKGVSHQDAVVVAGLLSKYTDFWVEHMLLHELSIVPPRDDISLWENFQNSFVMFASFMLFGMTPVLAYCISLRFTHATGEVAFAISALVSVLALFSLGGIKSYMADTNWFVGGAIMGLQGSVAGASAFFIGSYLGAPA